MLADVDPIFSNGIRRCADCGRRSLLPMRGFDGGSRRVLEFAFPRLFIQAERGVSSRLYRAKKVRKTRMRAYGRPGATSGAVVDKMTLSCVRFGISQDSYPVMGASRHEQIRSQLGCHLRRIRRLGMCSGRKRSMRTNGPESLRSFHEGFMLKRSSSISISYL